jgi:hypothetical protein
MQLSVSPRVMQLFGGRAGIYEARQPDSRIHFPIHDVLLPKEWKNLVMA